MVTTDSLSPQPQDRQPRMLHIESRRWRRIAIAGAGGVALTAAALLMPDTHPDFRPDMSLHGELADGTELHGLVDLSCDNADDSGPEVTGQVLLETERPDDNPRGRMLFVTIDSVAPDCDSALDQALTDPSDIISGVVDDVREAEDRYGGDGTGGFAGQYNVTFEQVGDDIPSYDF